MYNCKKVLGPLGGLFQQTPWGGGSCRDLSLPQSARVQDKLELIHEIIRTVCASLYKMSGGFLSLRLV